MNVQCHHNIKQHLVADVEKLKRVRKWVDYKKSTL